MTHPLRSVTCKLILLLVLLIAALGVFQIVLTVKTTRLHLMQVDQSLNRELAGHILQDSWFTNPEDLLANDFGAIFDRLMNINPTTEIYLLDQDGTILRFSAPPERVKLDKVATEPVATFVGGSTNFPIVGSIPGVVVTGSANTNVHSKNP